MLYQMDDVLSVYALQKLGICTPYFYIGETSLLNHLKWGRSLSIIDTKNYGLIVLLLLTALLVGKSVNGYPGGGSGDNAGEDWADDVIANGCTCHTDEQLNEGMYSLDGIPNAYVPETTYDITLVVNDTNVDSVDGAMRYGGFLAEVSEGSFVSNENYWVGGGGSYISHNENSNMVRSWVFQWTAPGNGSGDALFTLYFNVVNGAATTGDQWSYLTAVSLGTPQEVSSEVSIHELGVTLMQYWIGLIGIASVLLSILIAYVVIRGGSAHYRG
jgi:hypothetical protein